MGAEAEENGTEEARVLEASTEENQAGEAPLSLEEIKACDICEMAKDKFKSRQLQRSLARGGTEHSELIFAKARPHISELVNDQHGNYLMQKIMEVATTEQFALVFNLIKADLITMAKDSHGTRAVQKIVEQSIAREHVDQLLEALPAAQVEELARHITGFHVIVKMLESLPAEKSAELLERLCGDPAKVMALGKDQWGCCVLKKCVDRSEGALREKIIDSIAQNSLDLVQDAFGNYVVQHLIINRAPGQNPNVGRIIDALKGHVFELCLQKYSSNVLEKCLANSPDKERNKIINEILNPGPNLKASEAIRKLLFHQFGNYVFQQALEVSRDPQFSLLIEHSKVHLQDLYLEASKHQGQGGRSTGDSPASAGGNLPTEHTQRLAVKLVKKYPSITEGMDMGNMMGMDPWTMGGMFDYDPMGYGLYTGGYGMDAFGYPFPPMDAYGYGDFAFPGGMPPMHGQGAKGSGQGPWKKSQGAGGKANSRGGKGKQGGGQKGGKGGQAAAAAGGDGETVRVGRIVGFWPNYEITYDDLPTSGQGGANSRGGRQKNKAKSKAAPKPPTA